MFKFFKFRLLGGAQSLAPVVKGANNTKFVLERLITVELEVLVCVGGLTVHRKREFPCSVSLGFGVEHRDGLVPFILSGEFDGSIYRVDVDPYLCYCYSVQSLEGNTSQPNHLSIEHCMQYINR